MSLHTAVGPGHFCCDTGLCLPSEMKCDNSKDCADLSDETNCRLLERNSQQGYRLQVRMAAASWRIEFKSGSAV